MVLTVNCLANNYDFPYDFLKSSGKKLDEVKFCLIFLAEGQTDLLPLGEERCLALKRMLIRLQFLSDIVKDSCCWVSFFDSG